MTLPEGTNKKPPRKSVILPAIGWREWIDLPDWGATMIKAKIDTGARTSALHVDEIDRFKRGTEAWVRFVIPRSREHGVVEAEARLVDKRQVKSSIGEAENRYVVETLIRMGSFTWAAEISLTDRTKMEFPMLIGRTALNKRFVVNPAKSFLQSSDAVQTLKLIKTKRK